ncbi:MAG: universal stress protein [Roseinatronobacter sp.]
MYHHILIAIAHEPGLEPASSLSVAKSLAAPDAEVTLLHVMEPAPVFALSYMPEGWQRDLRAAIATEMGILAKQFPKAQVVVTEGEAARDILDHAELHGVDCIILTSHRPGTRGLFLGSTASKVVNRAQCAVHVARPA